MEKIVIHADADVSELIPVFLENRRKDVEEIAQALAKADYEKIRTLGHCMKGAGTGYGFEGITRIGAGLEEAAKAADAARANEWFKALCDYLEHVEVVYE